MESLCSVSGQDSYFAFKSRRKLIKSRSRVIRILLFHSFKRICTESLCGVIRIRVYHSNHAENIRNHWVEWPGFPLFSFNSRWKHTESLSGVIRIHVFHPNPAVNVRNHCGVIRIHLFHPNWAENVWNHCVERSGFIFVIQIKLNIFGITMWSDQNLCFSSKFSWKLDSSV